METSLPLHQRKLRSYVFDIETGPIPVDELEAQIPPFDPAEVKVGNIKDPAKIAAKLAEAEEKHHQDHHDKAALDALTGRVLAIGLLKEGELDPIILQHKDEAVLLSEFWELCTGEGSRPNELIGFNIGQFDLPFLFRRSWKHQVTPVWQYRRGRYWSVNVVDLRDIWQLGDRQARGSLDRIARHLGLEGKTEGVSGRDFYTLWISDRQAAVDYLKNDLRVTAEIAERLGAFRYSTEPEDML